MTCCGFGTNIFPRKGRLSSYDVKARQRSKEIDSELKIERKKRQHQVRLLLLGAGESGIVAKTYLNVQYAYNNRLLHLLWFWIQLNIFIGKSTFVKLMRIINDVEFSADDINEYKNIIYMNIIKGKQDSIILSSNKS